MSEAAPAGSMWLSYLACLSVSLLVCVSICSLKEKKKYLDHIKKPCLPVSLFKGIGHGAIEIPKPKIKEEFIPVSLSLFVDM